MTTEDAAAERLWRSYLERVAAGGEESFAELCAAHPRHADALRAAQERWLSASGLLDAMGGGGAGSPSSVRYRVEGEVATGGMGSILEVWDPDLLRTVAMKVARGRADEQLRARFLEEAQVTGQLEHPGVVPVHELGLDAEGQPYFTMRLMREGRTLGDVFELVREGDERWTRARALDALLRGVRDDGFRALEGGGCTGTSSRPT